MLRVEMTPKLLGFKISGDWDDLNELYDAIWELTIADDDFPDDKRLRGNVDEIIMSTRLLALCYDIRHAYQGSRNIELVHSGMSEEDAHYHGVPFVERNVVFSVEVLYPEAMYEVLVLSYLIQKRRSALAGRQTYWSVLVEDEKTLFDKQACVVRAYQAKLLEAVEKRATPGRFARIRKELAGGYHSIPRLYQQWVDILNNDHATRTEKQRAEGMSTVVRDMTHCLEHDQYIELVRDVNAYAESHGVTRDNVEVPGLYGWGDIDW